MHSDSLRHGPQTGGRRAIVISLVYGRVRARVPERRDAERAYASSTYAVSVNAILLAWTDALKRTVRRELLPTSRFYAPLPSPKAYRTCCNVFSFLQLLRRFRQDALPRPPGG